MVYDLNVAPIFPLNRRCARLLLPYSGSLGSHFPTRISACCLLAVFRYYDLLRLPNALLRLVRSSLSLPDSLLSRLLCVPFPVHLKGASTFQRLEFSYPVVLPDRILNKEALRLSQVPEFPL